MPEKYLHSIPVQSLYFPRPLRLTMTGRGPRETSSPARHLEKFVKFQRLAPPLPFSPPHGHFIEEELQR